MVPPQAAARAQSRYNMCIVRTRALAIMSVVVALAACGGNDHTAAQPSAVAGGKATSPLLQIREIRASVVRMGTLRYFGEAVPLYSVRVRVLACMRSRAEANRTYPTRYRIAHYVPRTRRQARWGRPFRVMENELHWLVPFGETGGACRRIDFDDVLPRSTYGGVESPLGLPGDCYGVRLTLEVALVASGRSPTRNASAIRRAIVKCGPFGPR